MLESSAQAPKKYETGEIKNRDKNKLFHSDRQFHDWYRFVLSFPPQLVRDYFLRFELEKGKVVLDPFCGTGTTLVEAKFAGFQGLGFEANHFAQFASETKLDWSIDGAEFLDAARTIRQTALEELARLEISDDGGNESVTRKKLRRLDNERQKLLLKDSISELPLHKSLVLLEEIRRHQNTGLYKSLALALANVVVFKSSNLRFGPEVGIGKVKDDAPVIGPWFEQVQRMNHDLLSISGHSFPAARVIRGDSRQINKRLKPKSVDAVITSPPYPNEKDYTRTTRLESVLLDLVRTKDELRTMKKGLLRSNTRGVYKEDDDDRYVQNVFKVQRLADEIEERRISLGKTSGFERMYAKVTKLYFGGMARHFEEMKPYLSKNARLAYVVGDQASYLQVMIRTGHILGEIAESLGYVDINIVPFRTRFSTATKSNLNEEVVTFRWPGSNKREKNRK